MPADWQWEKCTPKIITALETYLEQMQMFQENGKVCKMRPEIPRSYLPFYRQRPAGKKPAQGFPGDQAES